MKFKIPDTPEELFRQGGEKFFNIQKWIPLIFFIFLITFVAGTSFYSVEQDEVGIIRRFGKYQRTTDPGLHWKFPFGIENLDKVKVKHVFKEEFGFRTVQAGVKTQYSNKSYADEALMLTGDLNVLDVSWIVQFTVKDPVKLLFNVKDPKSTVRDISESVMRQVIGDHSVAEALTSHKNQINNAVKIKLQEVLDSYDSGIKIGALELQEVLPPERVAPSFNRVNQAEQEREEVIQQALKGKEQIILEEKGKAERTISEAEGYATARVERAEGDANKFLKTWNAYKSAKQVTRKRIYLETIEEIIPKAGQIFIFEPEANGALPLLNLNK